MTDTKQRIADGYAIQASDYDQLRLVEPRGLLLSQHDIRLVNEMLHPPMNTQLLEVGAGTGRFTLPILERGYSVIATDINASLLDGLQIKASEIGLADRCVIKCESVFDLSFEDASHDFVYSFHILPRFLSVDDQAEAIKEIGRVIKPNGYFLFNYRNSKSPYKLLYRGHAVSASQIKRMLQDAGMQIIETRGKHLSSRKLYDILPMFANHVISGIDRRLQNTLTSWAWDVFVLAQKMV